MDLDLPLPCSRGEGREVSSVIHRIPVDPYILVDEVGRVVGVPVDALEVVVPSFEGVGVSRHLDLRGPSVVHRVHGLLHLLVPDLLFLRIEHALVEGVVRDGPRYLDDGTLYRSHTLSAFGTGESSGLRPSEGALSYPHEVADQLTIVLQLPGLDVELPLPVEVFRPGVDDLVERFTGDRDSYRPSPVLSG